MPLDLSALRSKIEEHNLSPISDSKTPSTLFLFLHIYSKAAHESYIHYHRGAIELLEFLAPIDIASSLAKYPEASNPNFRVPSLLQGYASSELAKLLHNHYPKYSIQVLSNLIYFIMRNEVIQELY